MKKNYFEGIIIVVLYTIVSTVLADSQYEVIKIFNYPMQIIRQPFSNRVINFEAINLALFTIYFLWSMSCIYLTIIKKAIKALPLKKL